MTFGFYPNFGTVRLIRSLEESNCVSRLSLGEGRLERLRLAGRKLKAQLVSRLKFYCLALFSDN
jgi:hypothetical protein